MFILMACLVLIAAALVDFTAANYIKAIKASNGHIAGCWSIANALVGILGASAIIKFSFWYLVPECIGLYVGTRVAAYRKLDKDIGKADIRLDNFL